MIRLSVLTTCGLALLAAGTNAQVASKNVALLNHFQPNGGFNDVWGYLDPATGKEYAILLGRSGTYILDASDPNNPIQRGFISGTTSTWRDARTYGQHLYVVTEGSGGMQIISLVNPNNPTLIKTWSPGGGTSWGNSHNISIDTATGMCYPCGIRNSGTLVIDLTGDPVNPTLIGSYATEYVHDLQVQNGYAHLAEINRDRYRIMDWSNLPSMTSLAFRTVSSAHNAWPTRDDQYAVTTSERSNGLLTVFDIRNKSNPSQIATWGIANGTSIHNAFIKDRVVGCSYYTEGYRAVDLSNPSNPVEVGFFDTSTSTSTYSGNWGCYPFQPSGVVYMSDMSNGLWIIKPKATAEAYGTGTAGTGGVVPEIHTFGAAYLGNATFGLEVEQANANSSAFYIVGTKRATISFGGLTLLVDTLTGAGAIISGSTNANGHGSTSLPVPNVPALDGLVLNAQALIADPNGPLGYSATAGTTFEAFAR